MVASLIWILKSNYAILGSITSRDVKRMSLLFQLMIKSFWEIGINKNRLTLIIRAKLNPIFIRW